MAYILEILIIIIGIIYGYMKPGKEDRSALLKRGVIIGIILGAINGSIGINWRWRNSASWQFSWSSRIY